MQVWKIYIHYLFIEGWTALAWASANGYVDISKYLLSKGAITTLEFNKSIVNLSRNSKSKSVMNLATIDPSDLSFSDAELENMNNSHRDLFMDGPQFNWDTCQMDQLYVFEAAYIDHIIYGIANLLLIDIKSALII